MYHRRKQRYSEGTCRQYVIDDEESTVEPTINVDSENRTDHEESSIVISDSDDGELQEESILPKKRRRPPLHRKPLPVRKKIAHMTEEEQLALAVKISQQEQTKQEKYTQEEEEELINKAIEESLNSCQVPEIPVSDAKEELTNKSPSNKEHFNVNDHVEEPHLSKVSGPSAEDSTKSPFVILQRLSQDIVESSSVILSPNCKDPVSCIETSRQSPLSPCTSRDFVKMSPAKGIALSPVFPKSYPCSRKLIPCRLFKERSTSADQLVDDVDDRCTHCSESPQIGSSCLPTSQGESSYETDSASTKNLNIDKAKEIDCEDSSSVDGIENSDCRSDKCNQSGGTVHYYWGVPFCPKGVDPNEYTKVILCQLEVYEKSLKTAQRQLLHKVDYGEPIHLEAVSQENVKEDVQGNISHEDIEDSAAEDDIQKTEDGEQENGDNSDSEETGTECRASKRQKVSESPEKSVLEYDHRSSSQGGKQKTPFTKLLPSECTGVALVAPGESAVSPTAVRNDRHLMEHTEIAQEEEITVCPETQPSPAMQEGSDKEDHTEEMETAPEPQEQRYKSIVPNPSFPSASAENQDTPYGSISQLGCHQLLQNYNSQHSACMSSESSDEDLVCLDKIFPNNVTCPMCECDFPKNQIERHAAYCDGTNEQQEMPVLRPRNKLRRPHHRSTVGFRAADSGKCETCYLCKSLVPLKDYQTHVDNCLQTAMLSTPGSQRLRSSKQEYPGRNGRLLSMLEQSDSSLAGNSNAPEPSHLSPPTEENEDSFSSEHLNLGDSPIRSFVSISEATDCLVDFKKQLNRQPSSRRATHRGRGRRM